MATEFPLSENKRYFVNLYDEGTNDDDVVGEGKERVASALLRSLDDVLIKYSPEIALTSKDLTVYTGVGGIWILLDKLISSPLELLQKERSRLEKFQALYFSTLETLIEDYEKRKRSAHRVTLVEGIAGSWAIQAIHYHRTNQLSKYAEALGKIKNLKDAALTENSDEILYGRAGFLLALKFVETHIPGSIEYPLIEQVIEKSISVGKQLKQGKSLPLMYAWHDSEYLGAAHGITGILHTFLLFPQSKLFHEPIKKCIDFFAKYITKHKGEFPSRLASEPRLTQWCHGPPGAIFMLCAAYKVFKSEKYIEAAIEAAEVVWRKGILSKGPGLCHGTSGNGYCFLTLYRITHDVKYLARAHRFADAYLNLKNRMNIPDEFVIGLYQHIPSYWLTYH